MSQTALKSDTLHENLVRELSRMAPGEKFMTVRDIMRRYNVSQLIVDRAVNRLCKDGKLVSFARRGLFVPQFVRPAPAEQPTLLVAVPDWVSPDIDEIKAELERLAPLHPETRLLLHRFDYRYAIPPELPLAAENVRLLLLMPGRVDTLEARDIEALNIFRKNGPVMVLCHHLNNFNVPSVGLDDMFAGNAPPSFVPRRTRQNRGPDERAAEQRDPRPGQRRAELRPAPRDAGRIDRLRNPRRRSAAGTGLPENEPDHRTGLRLHRAGGSVGRFARGGLERLPQPRPWRFRRN